MKSFFKILVLFYQLGIAQVGINTTNPDISSILDIHSTDKGVLIPKINLTNVNQMTLDGSNTAATGLLIWNTNTSVIGGTGTGFYFFDGIKWNSILDSSILGLVWSPWGNSGTISGTHFIGTTDMQDVDFRTNNTLKMRLSQKGQLEIFNGSNSLFIGEEAGENDDLSDNRNTFIGYRSGYNTTIGSYNTSIGYQSLFSNVDGFYNIGIGNSSLFSNTNGLYNTAIGFRSLYTNTTGIRNTALGFNSMYNNSTGSYNFGLGTNALGANISGSYNIAIGSEAIKNNQTGNSNIGIGNRALYNSTGNNNIAIGEDAMYQNTVGEDNISIGSFSLANNVTGYGNTVYGIGTLMNSGTYVSENTAIGGASLQNCNCNQNTTLGAWSGYQKVSGWNNIIIGYSANTPNATGSNQVRIGNNLITYAGIQVPWTTTSDRRWKENIQPTNLGLNFIKSLNPVFYTRINDKSKKTEYGFIAQELEASLDQFGAKNNGIISKDDDGYYGVRYNDLIATMVKAIQEQEATISQQQSEIELLKAQLKQQQELLNQLVNQVQNIKNN